MITARAESDDDLRRRLLYVAGDGEAAIDRIRRAERKALDEIADALGLRRMILLVLLALAVIGGVA